MACCFPTSGGGGWSPLSPQPSLRAQWPYFFHRVQLALHFCGSVSLHPPLCILDSLQDPSLWSLGLAFVGLGGLYSSMYLSSKMLPYGRIFLKVSSVVNSLKPLLPEDNWLFHDGSQMREFCRPPWGAFPVRQRRGALWSSTAFDYYPENPLHLLRKGTRNPEEDQNLENGQRKRILRNTPPKPKTQQQNWEWAAHDGGDKPRGGCV